MTQTCRPGLAFLQAPRRGMCMGCVSEVLRRAGNHCSGPALRRAGFRGKDGGGSVSPSRSLQPREEDGGHREWAQVGDRQTGESFGHFDSVYMSPPGCLHFP